MPFLLLLFLIPACVPDDWAPPVAPLDRPGLSAGLTWLGVALLAALARAIAAGLVRGLAHPGQRERVLRRYGRARTIYAFALMGGYALSLYVVGWGWAVQQFCGHGHDMPPGAELLVLAPFLASLLLSWVFFYDAERALHDTAEPDLSEPAEPFWSRGAYVTFHARQNLALVFAPLLLLLLMKGAHRLLPDGDDENPWAKAASYSGVVLSLAVFVFMPWLLRLVLGAKPLPPGPLRGRLETTARRLGFRYSNILVWDTHGGVANAMVAGIVPWVRYVLLTDRLMSELTPDELEAVFGHEVGHVKHHHMIYYLGFLLVSVGLVGGVWSWLAADALAGHHQDSVWQVLPPVLLLGAYIFVVFGFLSRRCERQADLYGCRAVSCPRDNCCGHGDGAGLAPAGRGLCPTGIRTFIDALEKVARLNGISRDRPGWLSSWQHSTIARRVAFLQDVLHDPPLERRFQRRVALVKWGLFLGLLAAVVGVWLLSAFWARERPRQPVAGAPAALAGDLDSLTPRTAARTGLSE